MWRTKGEGELYTYLPSPSNPGFEANDKLCHVAPSSDCNPTYGASVGRGSFGFKSGQWNTVSQRVRLNDVGQSNGELQLFFNGQSVINVKGLKFRNSAEGRFRGIQAQTFFGGKLLVAVYLPVRVSHHSSLYRFEAGVCFPQIPEHLVLRLLRCRHQDALSDSRLTTTSNNSRSLPPHVSYGAFAPIHSLPLTATPVPHSLSPLVNGRSYDPHPSDFYEERRPLTYPDTSA